MTSLIVSGCSSKPATKKQENQDLNYPTRQIELVVPFAAGGGVDLAARTVAEYLSKEWGQPIVVTNKTGGGGIIGAQYALKDSKPDGYTVLVNNNSSTSMHEAGTSNPTLTIEDNKFISRIATGSIAYAVQTDAEWNNFEEFSKWVKANPEKLTWASVGPAGISAFAVAQWLESIGVDYHKTKMISSEGASDSAAKVAGGHVVLGVHTVGEFAPLVDSGKIKLLAVQSPERNPLYPDIPTTKEQGFEGLTVKWWTGLSFAPGTPDEIVEKWDKAIEKMQKDEEFIKQLEKVKLEPGYLNSEDFTSEVQTETDIFTKLAEETGIRK
ncbi:tripartite tricarboxylate transporter substrate binding protein [Niallia endozanthoxylica]|uniref:Tripartite tricarboxylate transporter substrate binding protein n=2 Tax=Niallia endozanthoxylica TaxID=2036016 RepID=A0A5J5HZS9_9BACI|nr:tripartite tricarboxylate transporter substrate binding protein [Niallia endozanthoxylica]